jgi:ligand-binding sensor domain-containing protein/putative methionine-R-sulfoxide reductase with GAF domain
VSKGRTYWLNVAGGRWLCLGLICALAYAAQAQVPPLRNFYFQHAGLAQGLTHRHINGMLRDRNGYIWVATGNGLNCFDGVHFQSWKVDPSDPKAMENPVLQGLCEDARGDIWCTSEAGVTRYDHHRFYNYHLQDAETGEKARYYNWAVKRTHHDEIVACGTGGLFFFDAKGDSFVQAIPQGPDGRRLFRGVHKNSMAIDTLRNGIWLGTDQGIAYFDLATRKYYNYLHNPKHWLAFSTHSIHPVVLDPQGRVVYHDYDLDALVTWRPEQNDSTQLSTAGWSDRREYFATIFFDAQRNMWMSTWTPHAYFREANTGQVYRFEHNPRDQYSVNSNFFWDVHEDADGTVYIGSMNGLSFANPKHAFFSILQLPEGINHRSNYVNSLYLNADQQKQLWLAPNYDFLLRWDMATGDFRRFEPFGKPDLANRGRKRISAMQATRDTLYFGTSDGIYTFDVHTEQFARLPYLPASLGLAGHWITVMKLNRRGELWFGASGWGLVCYNIHTHGYRVYRNDPNDAHSISKEGIGTIEEDAQGEMWLSASVDGIVRYDRQHDRFDYMPESMREVVGFGTSMVKDPLGNFWTVNSTYGLMRYNPKEQVLDHSFPREQLSHFSYGAMLIDKDQRLWFTNFNDFSTLDTRDGTVANFRVDHGQEDSKWANFLAALPDGRIVSESRNALILFDPDVRTQSAFVDPIVISHFASADTTIMFLEGVGDLQLATWQNHFSLDFGSIDLLKSGERKWQYMLEGFDKQWVDCGDRRTAFYTNVPAGNYTFQVRVKDAMGQWHTAEHPVHLHIAQVFYRTLVFRLLLVLLLLAIVFWWARGLRRRHALRENERAISYFANSLHGSNQVSDILWDITQNVMTRTNLVDGVIYLLDEKGEYLVQMAAFGSKNPTAQEIVNPLRIPWGKGIVGTAAATAEVILVADTRKDPRYIADHSPCRSEVSVPIIHEGRVLGVIDSEHPRKHFFTQAQVELLKTIANISANKIANAQRASEIQEKEERLRLLQAMVSETRQQALRAQMNPHFIFNCLNSINSFILENDSDTASTYLIKFSRLIRLILENSNDKYISLQSELDALKLYIEMESLRFATKFQWTIAVDDSVAAHHIMVPPLILQPFVENAIWHGLLHKDGPGTLTVQVSQTDQCLVCLIQDNGIGRQASAQYKETSLIKKQSLGLKLTEERLALMNEQGEKKFSLTITDNLNADGSPAGTQVRIDMEL